MKEETNREKKSETAGKTLREEVEEALAKLEKVADVTMSHPGYVLANDKLAQWARRHGRRFCLKLLDFVRVAEAELDRVKKDEE